MGILYFQPTFPGTFLATLKQTHPWGFFTSEKMFSVLTLIFTFNYKSTISSSLFQSSKVCTNSWKSKPYEDKIFCETKQTLIWFWLTLKWLLLLWEVHKSSCIARTEIIGFWPSECWLCWAYISLILIVIHRKWSNETMR